MLGIFGKPEGEAEIRSDIDKKIAETEEAFRVARVIYDRFGLPDGDYYTSFENFCGFTEIWNSQGRIQGKLQLKLIRMQLNIIHKQRMIIVSNLIKQYGRPNE